jgi:hypothetical protein
MFIQTRPNRQASQPYHPTYVPGQGCGGSARLQSRHRGTCIYTHAHTHMHIHTCMNSNTYTRTYTHIHISTYIYTYIYIRAHTYTQHIIHILVSLLCLRTHTHRLAMRKTTRHLPSQQRPSVWVRMYVCVWLWVRECECLWVRVCVCVCVCACVECVCVRGRFYGCIFENKCIHTHNTHTHTETSRVLIDRGADVNTRTLVPGARTETMIRQPAPRVDMGGWVARTPLANAVAGECLCVSVCA